MKKLSWMISLSTLIGFPMAALAESKAMTLEGEYGYVYTLPVDGKVNPNAKVCFFDMQSEEGRSFCFQDTEQAKKLLAIPAQPKECGVRGKAKVVIANYQSNAKGVYLAELQSVLQHSDASEVACAHVLEGIKPITVEGQYTYTPNNEVMNEEVCFYPSEPTAKLIPRPKEDERMPWFCFDDMQQAKQALGLKMSEPQGCGVEGQAKLVVSGYRRYVQIGEGFDLAKLDKVLQVSAPKAIACESTDGEDSAE